MCYGYRGFSDQWWEEAQEWRRLERDRRRQQVELVQRRQEEHERQRREVLRARQDEELRRLERSLTEAEREVEVPAKSARHT